MHPKVFDLSKKENKVDGGDDGANGFQLCQEKKYQELKAKCKRL